MGRPILPSGCIFSQVARSSAGLGACAMTCVNIGCEREVSSGGVTGRHQARGIDVIILGIANYPTQGAPAVLDSARSFRSTRHPVLDVHWRPPHPQVGEDFQYSARFVPEDPAASVNVDYGWN